MSRGVWYIIAVGLVIIVAVGTAGEYSLRSATCMACHTQEASFARWMAGRLKADKKGFSHELIACADCHIEGTAAGTLTSRLRGLFHIVTYVVPQLDPRRGQAEELFTRARIPSENCQYCHLAAQYRKEVYLRDLPPGLKKIGLVMDHRKHVLARDDTCAKCHERYKEQGSSQADKTVTYTEVNHLACDSCHTSASHAYRAGRLLPMTDKEYLAAREVTWNKLSTNPRWMVALPSEKACSRCHNGKIHYKTKIFLADCREDKNFENCVKCHPLMTKEYFEQYRKDREKMASDANNESNGSQDLAAATWESHRELMLSPHGGLSN
jgi:nitrate/TMAO reductase-like tetraheme cytochrome c subunit